jgi:hypothetical protein
MGTLKKYNEVATRFQKIGNRDVKEGEVVRTVAISERDAEIMNGTVGIYPDEPGFKYVLAEAKEPTEKEIRKELFAKAEGLGLTPAKNIKTDDLRKLIEEKENEANN